MSHFVCMQTLPLQNGKGCLSEILKLLRHTRVLLCVRGLKLFFTSSGSNIVKQHLILCHFFWLNTLKGTTNGPAEDLMRLNTLRDTQTTFLTPKRFSEHPRGYTPIACSASIKLFLEQNARINILNLIISFS